MHWLIRGAVITALLIVTDDAAAQLRGPVWARMSVSRADLQVNCNICRSVEQTSWAADVAVGGWLSTRTKFGGELAFWRRGSDDVTQRLMQIGAVGQIYPYRVPAFIKLGIGLLTYSASDGEESLRGTSLAGQVGVGVDVPLRHGYIIVPQATLVQALGRGLYLEDTRVTSWSRFTIVRIGLGVGVGR